MGIFTKKNHGREYDYALIGKKQFFLAPKGEQSSKPEKVLEALKYAKEYYGDTIDLESRLISYLPQPERDRYTIQLINELEKQIKKKIASLSDSAREQYEAAEDRTRLRRLETYVVIAEPEMKKLVEGMIRFLGMDIVRLVLYQAGIESKETHKLLDDYTGGS